MINDVITTKTVVKIIFQKEFPFFNSINWKATNRNLIAEIPIIETTEILWTVIKVAINTVDKVSRSRVAYVKINDFFMIRKWDIKQGIIATKSNRTCAKKQHKPQHLQ